VPSWALPGAAVFAHHHVRELLPYHCAFVRAADTPCRVHACELRHAGELKRKLAEDGSLDFVERRTAPLQSCYAPALFARLRQAGDWVCSFRNMQPVFAYICRQMDAMRAACVLIHAICKCTSLNVFGMDGLSLSRLLGMRCGVYLKVWVRDCLILRAPVYLQGNGKVKRWSSLSSYFLSKLTGKLQPMTYSEASCTGLLDREELQWHQGLLNLLGIHLNTLPTLCDADQLYKDGIADKYAKRWPELRTTAWSRGIGEPAALLIGTGGDAGTRPRICVNMGTSAAIRVCLSCNDRRYRSKSSGDGDKGAAHGQEGSRKAAKLNDEDTALPAGLFRFSMKRDLMLVGGSLADGGSVYAWGTEQLAGLPPFCPFSPNLLPPPLCACASALRYSASRQSSVRPSITLMPTSSHTFPALPPFSPFPFLLPFPPSCGAAGGLEEMARLQEEASAMDADSHGLTVLPFFSGGGGSGGNGGVSHLPSLHVPAADHARSPLTHPPRCSVTDVCNARAALMQLFALAQATTGTLTGMTLRTSRAGILRAVMESVALRLKAVFTSIVSILPDDSFEVLSCLPCAWGYAHSV
jgi:hypothetical protein